MYDLTRLATLVAVSETGSINQAAARLGYTPPALSQQLTKLEREVGMPLLVRSRRGVELTAAGRTLVEYARRVMQTLDEARDALREIAGQAVQSLRIGSFTTGGMYLLPPALLEFRRSFPQVQTSLHEYEPPSGVAELADGEIDLLVTHAYEHGPQPELPPSLTSEVLTVEDLLLVTSPDHPLANRAEPVSYRELARWPLISGSRGFANREALEALFRAEGLPAPNVMFETGNYATACSLAVEGSAIALIPSMVLPDLPHHSVSSRPLAAPGLHRTIFLVRRSAGGSPELDALRLCIRRACQRLTPPVADGGGAQDGR